jgi:hypothetical protein
MSTPAPAPAGRLLYAGLFLVTAATLAFQILLTRIFSVTIWYHFAFLAISVAMLGMTIGANAVYLLPGTFTPERRHAQLARWSAGFGAAMIAALLVHLAIPVTTDGSLRSIASLAFTCALIAVPFTASGVVVTLVLTGFPRQIGGLYAVDLAGAALGCLLLIPLMAVADGPSAVFAVALLALLAALCFAAAGRVSRGRIWIAVAAAAVAAFALANAIAAYHQRAIVRVAWKEMPRGPRLTPRPLYEQWNTHSRIRVDGDPDRVKRPFGWSMSPRLDPGLTARELYVEIDSGALTVLTAWDGDRERVSHLRYDITNLAHRLRRDARVLVIGAGGGRDVLSALAFEQRSVVGLEVNGSILDLLNRRFGDFTGHLDRRPGVRFVHDEARSWVARSPERFDIIQISLIDSFAATAAGAFVLTENSLYTVEAWQAFLEHLDRDGILTVTRDYFEKNPGAAYRMTGLAGAALARLGVDDPRPHIALLRIRCDELPFTMGTLLVSRDPFSGDDLAVLREVGTELGFEAVLTPDFAADETFRRIADGGELDAFYAGLPFDVSPSSDDRPFFFHMLRLRDVLDRSLWEKQGAGHFNVRAVLVLGVLLATVTLLTVCFVIVPLLLRRPIADPGAVVPWLLVFAGIGAGFMIVEISQMQRLIVFLGHPVYALSVVLFTLLLASGAGSLSTKSIAGERLARSARIRVSLLLLALAVFGLTTPMAVEAMGGATTPVRILVSVLILAPIGFAMGMLLPISMQLAARSDATRDLTPWLWGINGATSVLASVIAVAIAMSAGIAASFWVGVGCYAVAAAALLRAAR